MSPPPPRFRRHGAVQPAPLQVGLDVRPQGEALRRYLLDGRIRLAAEGDGAVPMHAAHHCVLLAGGVGEGQNGSSMNHPVTSRAISIIALLLLGLAGGVAPSSAPSPEVRAA